MYLVGKAATSPPQKKKSAAAAKKRKSNESPTESEASSASNESESNRSAPTPKKNKAPNNRVSRVSPGSKQAQLEMKAAGKRPGKRTKLPVKNVEIQFAGSQKEGIPVVDSRPGKKHTRAGRKKKV